jgi:hypothetical protein
MELLYKYGNKNRAFAQGFFAMTAFLRALSLRGGRKPDVAIRIPEKRNGSPLVNFVAKSKKF